MKDGRAYDKLPVVAPDDFSVRWRAWWISLQPLCRRSTDVIWPLLRVIPEDVTDWDTVRKGGPGGIFLAVMGLAWWLSAVTEAGGSMQDVYDAISDVAWVCRSVTTSVSKKRPAGDGLSDEERVTQEKRPRIE